MSYSPAHTARTRRRILEQAARLFRLHGYSGVGIDTIMAASGLTRGGFYAHFASKGALFAAVLRVQPDLAIRLRASRGTRVAAPTAATRVVLDGYLDPANLDRVTPGCSMATLTLDAARAGAEPRAAFTRTFHEIARELGHHVHGAHGREAERRVLTALALCVGGLSLGRALDDDALVRRLLAACRELVVRELGRPRRRRARSLPAKGR